MSLAAKFRVYKELSKSGIITLVLLSVVGGFVIGHPVEQPLPFLRLLNTLLGVMLLASGSSALNQLQDAEIDARMPRTAGRPIPAGKLSRRDTALYISATLVLGLAMLFFLSSVLGVLGVAAVLFYNGLYTLWWKRHWAFAAIPGAVPGALPILMGFFAANGELSAPGGWYVFALLFYWQMPHFWSLALRYKADYALGMIPTLPVALGDATTLRQIAFWTFGYLAIAGAAPLFFPINGVYWIFAGSVSLKVLWELWAFLGAPESKKWLHFFLWINFSLIAYLLALFLDLWAYPLFATWLI